MTSAIVRATLAYVVGLYIASRFDIVFAVMFAVCFGLVVLIRFALTRRGSGALVLVVLSIAAGVVAYGYANDARLQQNSMLEDQYVTIEGGITELPEPREDGLYYYVVTTTRTEHAGQEYSAGSRIRIASREIFKFGEQIRLSGFLVEMPPPKNSGEFDVARYYRAQGIYYQMYAHEAESIGISEREYSLHYLVNSIRAKIGERIDRYFTGDDAALLKAVLTGDKNTFSPAFEKLSYRTNTMRYLYSPYIHLLMLMGFISFFFGHAKKKIRNRILIVVLLLYAGINSATPIFLKTCLLTAAGTWFLERYGYSHLPDLLAFVVLVITLFNPLYAFDIGFILSIASSLLIYNCRSWTDRIILPVRGKFLRRTLTMWVLLSLGMAPLCAYFFNSISPYSPLLILLYMPCIILLLLVSPVFFFLQAVFGNGMFFAYFMTGMLFVLRKIPVLVDHIPFSYIRIGQPSVLFLAVFYLGLLVIKWARWQELYEKKTIAAISVCAGFSAVLLAVWIVSLGKLSLTFVNVGQGDGAILHIPMRETIIIDGGGGTEYSSYNAGEKVFLPYLCRKGYHTIDLAIVSHYHRDHCLGVIATMEELRVRDVLLPATEPANEYRQEIERIAREKGICVYYLHAGKVLRFPSGLEIRILAPDVTGGTEYTDSNDTSFVLEVNYGEFRALFTGDATAAVEQQILDRISDCDVVKIPHHGSATSSTEAFVCKTKPEVAVLSVGADNPYNLPDPEVVGRYRQTDAAVLSTAELGDITIITDKQANMQFSAFGK